MSDALRRKASAGAMPAKNMPERKAAFGSRPYRSQSANAGQSKGENHRRQSQLQAEASHCKQWQEQPKNTSDAEHQDRRSVCGQFRLHRARKVASPKVKKCQMPSFRQSSWSESRCSCFIALTKNEELGRGALERRTALFGDGSSTSPSGSYAYNWNTQLF